MWVVVVVVVALRTDRWETPGEAVAAVAAAVVVVVVVVVAATAARPSVCMRTTPAIFTSN